MRRRQLGNNISGCVGDKRGYLLDTLGIDVNNTTRFNVGDWRNAVTYGFDAFQDKVRTSDSRGNSNITTPGGQRTVSGGFVAVEAELFDLARSRQRDPLRPLRSEFADGVDRGGDRFSPKITVGVTPVAGFTPYVSYAEGYRAPSITETLIAGAHATGGGPAFFPCPGRHRAACSASCPIRTCGRRSARTRKLGFNLKYNDIFTSGDSFRGKFNVFRNDIDDYIDLVASTPIRRCRRSASFSQFFQYQNIAQARIEGFEAETMYDAGLWFVGVAGHLIRGKNVATNIGLCDHHAAQDHDDRPACGCSTAG